MSFHFILQRSGWGYDDLYEALLTGVKTSEFRDGSEHWRSRLLNEGGRRSLKRAEEIEASTIRVPSKPFLMDFPGYFWKYNRARFVVGRTKSPMLLADVVGISFDSKTDKFEVKIGYIKEVSR